jgi:hypothetical protein
MITVSVASLLARPRLTPAASQGTPDGCSQPLHHASLETRTSSAPHLRSRHLDKGADGVLEIIGGVLLLLISPAALNQLGVSWADVVNSLTHFAAKCVWYATSHLIPMQVQEFKGVD